MSPFYTAWETATDAIVMIAVTHTNSKNAFPLETPHVFNYEISD